MKDFSISTDKEVNNYLRTMERLTKNLNKVHKVKRVEENIQDMVTTPVQHIIEKEIKI